MPGGYDIRHIINLKMSFVLVVFSSRSFTYNKALLRGTQERPLTTWLSRYVQYVQRTRLVCCIPSLLHSPRPPRSPLLLIHIFLSLLINIKRIFYADPCYVTCGLLTFRNKQNKQFNIINNNGTLIIIWLWSSWW